MKCTLDSIFKVGFGMDLNCLGASSKDGSAFIAAFDETNALVYWRYADFLWKIKRFFNVGSEAVLRKNVILIDDFVYGVIRNKRKQLSSQGHCVSRITHISFICKAIAYLNLILLNFIAG